VDQRVSGNLQTFVENGGTLVASFRSGIKDRNNNMTDKTLPGELAKLFGVTIHAWDTLPEGARGQVRCDGGPLGQDEYPATLFADLITLQAAASLATYSRGWHEGYHAVTVNRVGKGSAVYVGTHLLEGFYRRLFRWLLPSCGFEPLLSLPDGVEVCTRTGKAGDVVFVLNFRDESQKLELPGKYRDLLADSPVSQKVELSPYGVAVLLREP
jgi:beta-galactosidase